MNPLLALAGLLLDRGLPALDRWRARPWFAAYLGMMREQFGAMRDWGGVAPALLIAGAPTALVALALLFLSAAHPLLAALGGLAVVVLALGPVATDRLGTAYVQALDADGDTREAALALLGAEPPVDAAARSAAVARALASGVVARRYGAALWAALAGPPGAVLWRCAAAHAEALTRDDAALPAQRAAAEDLLGVLGWLPARASALACALAGRSDDAFAAWRAWRRPHGTTLAAANADLAARVTLAALGVAADEEDRGAHLVWSMLALLDRALVLAGVGLAFVWLAWLLA